MEKNKADQGILGMLWVELVGWIGRSLSLIKCYLGSNLKNVREQPYGYWERTGRGRVSIKILKWELAWNNGTESSMARTE